MMTDDLALAQEYARNGSEGAFATLVSRHINLVYSVAVRQLREPHLAEDATQSTFIILARKAGAFTHKTIVSAWLCRTAQYVAADMLKAQRRRHSRQQEMHMQSLLNEPEIESSVWTDMAPALDTAMAELDEKDHAAIVLRFFQGQDLKGVGAALGVSENTAKTRVSRATDKLRKYFYKRGIRLSAQAIAAMIAAHSVQAAPIGLASAVTTGALKTTVLTTSAFTFFETTLKLMAWTKLKTALVLTAIIAAGGIATVSMQRSARNAAPTELTFSGYATPEASMQSTLWAASMGEMDKVAQGITDEEMQRFNNQMAGKTPAEIKNALVAWGKGMSGFEIREKKVVSADEVHLHIRATPSMDALRTGKATIRMKKVGGVWKQAGETN